ncbi:hypothetical protein BC629DRAFT_1466947 [Irpex lacteus]|nr:hypothetical protein BC629DRAFT_1466947 [Irpex lacteus]
MTESTNGSAQPAAHLGLNLGQGGSDPGSAGSSRQPPARQQQPSPPPTQAAQQPPQQPQQPVAPPPAQPPAQPAAQPEPARGQPAQQHPEQQAAPAVPQQDQQPAARAEDPVQEGQARGAVHAAAAPSVDLVAAIRDPNFLALWQQQLGNTATSVADPVAPTVGTLPVAPVSRRRELGPIVPGFRADPYARREYCFFILSSPPLSPLPRRIAEAFAAGDYIPYTQLNPREFAASGHTQEFFFGEGGVLQARSLDSRNDRFISLERWMLASQIAVTETRRYQGEARATALEKHHANVQTICGQYTWPIAREYDIRQRQVAACDSRHDLAGFDRDLIIFIIADNLAHPPPPPPTAPPTQPKRPRDNDKDSLAPPRKRTSGGGASLSSTLCFRCGTVGHLPNSCTAAVTSAGKPVEALMGGRHSNSLRSTSGQCYCFQFARSSACSYTDNCRNLHACSICRSSEHGAAACSSKA